MPTSLDTRSALLGELGFHSHGKHGLSLQTHMARDALMLGTLARRRSGTGSQRELARRNQGWGDEGFDQRGGD